MTKNPTNEEAVIQAYMALAKVTRAEATKQIRKASRKLLDKKSGSG